MKPKAKEHSARNTPSSALNKAQPTVTTKLQTEEMEVHHHPELRQKEKPWKEYLLEGLMIFVAVTLGFFAESLREHITDRDKEKEYIVSLIQNLKEDTTTINIVISENQRKLDKLTELMKMSQQDISSPAIRRIFYNKCRITGLYS